MSIAKIVIDKIKHNFWQMTKGQEICPKCDNLKCVSNFSPCYSCNKGSNFTPCLQETTSKNESVYIKTDRPELSLERDLKTAIEHFNGGAYTQYDIEVCETALEFVGRIKELAESLKEKKNEIETEN